MEVEKAIVRLRRKDRVRTIDCRNGIIVGGKGEYADVDIGTEDYHKVVRYHVSELTRFDLI